MDLIDQNLSRIDLKIDNFSFNKNNVLFDNFNTSINLNKRTKITGNNGTGKTTLFYIITKIINDNNIHIKYYLFYFINI